MLELDFVIMYMCAGLLLYAHLTHRTELTHEKHRFQNREVLYKLEKIAGSINFKMTFGPNRGAVYQPMMTAEHMQTVIKDTIPKIKSLKAQPKELTVKRLIDIVENELTIHRVYGYKGNNRRRILFESLHLESAYEMYDAEQEFFRDDYIDIKMKSYPLWEHPDLNSKIKLNLEQQIALELRPFINWLRESNNEEEEAHVRWSEVI